MKYIFINMNRKILFILLLALISFLNNFICSFDNFLYLSNNLKINFFIIDICEDNYLLDYLKGIFYYICYFIFFINQNPFSVFREVLWRK